MISFDCHTYVAFGEHGEYTRKAKTIGELPTVELRMAAIKRASKRLHLKVQFGVKIGHTNSFKPTQIQSDQSGLLSLRGADLPLSIFH